MEWVVPDWYQRTPKEEVERRISLFQALLRENGIESALIGDTVTEKVDLFYLSGTMQQAHLYVPAEGSPLLLVRKDLDRARLDSPLNRIVPLKSTDRLKDYDLWEIHSAVSEAYHRILKDRYYTEVFPNMVICGQVYHPVSFQNYW